MFSTNKLECVYDFERNLCEVNIFHNKYAMASPQLFLYLFMVILKLYDHWCMQEEKAACNKYSVSVLRDGDVLSLSLLTEALQLPQAMHKCLS